MNNNVTDYTSKEFDNKVLKTIPFYDVFHREIINLVQNSNINIKNWLDTGCGTGHLFLESRKLFRDTRFVLADPLNEMIASARIKIHSKDMVTFVNSSTQELQYSDNTFDIITAIQCHHYLDRKTRLKATENCFRMLKPKGIFITFENIRPLSENGIDIGLERWKNYQMKYGKSDIEARNHIERFDKEYFPISIIEHIDLLNSVGFNIVEVLWASYMQAGFYSIKD